MINCFLNILTFTMRYELFLLQNVDLINNFIPASLVPRSILRFGIAVIDEAR